ncbi:hypothetical protein RI129_011126 [Pyrocoelia pectoralis]|uniref:Retrotransposon gag domain-containing protein n=1 Tax=Pyrocoelia pectoralis TaxID=417401 RepID=A0AAN7V0G1_9COLE
MAEGVPATIQATFNVEMFEAGKNWSRWLQRLEAAFKIFRVVDEMKVIYLLHYIGSDSFDILCDKLTPEDPFAKPYDELVKILKAHHSPAPLEIAENYRFHQRKQEDGESLKDFVENLHKLSVYCNFGAYLTTALRNQIVFGLKSKRVQARILETPELTFERATQIGYAMELTEKGVNQIQGNGKEISTIHQVGWKAKKKPTGKEERITHKNTCTFTMTI